MYKPSLKRSQPNRDTRTSKEPNYTFNTFKKITQGSVAVNGDSLMVSSKLLEAPGWKNPEKKCILAPLFAQSHAYPPKVAELIDAQQNEVKKTIGAYKEINWISTGKQVEFWITGDTISVTRQFQAQISSLSVGELKSSSLPSKIRNHYILAVGIKNDVILYCLESFTLRVWETGIRYNASCSWQIQRIQFSDNNKLIFFSNPNYLQIVEFGEGMRVIQTAIPFYKRYLPSTFSQPNKIIENIIYSKNKIYVLYTEIKEKFWLLTTLHKIMDEEPFDCYVRTKNIEIFGVGQSSIELLYKITEQDLRNRMRNYLYGRKTEDFKIQNIFIDRETEKEEELGIITDNGIYLTLRDMSKVYFSKDPTFLENTITYQSAFLLSSISPYNLKSQRENQQCEVTHSLGFNNLTLTNESLIWAGAGRVDGVHCENLIAEMLLRRTDASECFMFNTSQWAVFTKNAFYTVRQLPIRHFIIAVIYANITQLDDYEPLSCQNSSYKAIIQRIENALSPQVLLKHLIEIIISGEKYVVVNNVVLDLVYRQLKGEVAQNYRDWSHELKPSINKKEIQVTTEILSKVWNRIFTLQYKQIPANLSKSKHICDSSVYWQSIHSIYYQLVSPLFKLHPQQFKNHKDLIQNIFNSLKSLQNFFQLKFKHEYFIREHSISKISKEGFGEDLNRTQTSIDREVDVSWVEEAVSRTISSKILSENIIQVQEKLKKAVALTLNLMTVYFGLSTHDIRLPSFGEVLKNRSDQQLLAKEIINNSDFATLVDINSKLPQLQLKKAIEFKSWANKMQLDKSQGITATDLQQLSQVIHSSYFQESLKILQNRFDLQLKMLQIYEEVIIGKRDSLIQSNTLKQRNFLSNTMFPQDQETFLAEKRDFYNSELDKIQEQERRCLKEAVTLLTDDTTKSTAQTSKMIDELIMIAANKPTLYDHLENLLKFSGNVQKYTKLQKLKYRQFHKYAKNSKINYKAKSVERQLFPHP